MALMAIVSKYNLHQQIRVLLRKLRDGKAQDATLLDEKLFISSALSLDAPQGEVERLEQSHPDTPITLTTGYNGLTGALGALPTAYTEWMIDRHYRYGDRGAKAFIDIFGHRLYCLDHLAWQKHHLYALAESQAQSPLHTAVLALTGLLDATPSATRMQYTPPFISSAHSMLSLERFLSQKFGVPAQITPFTGGWREVAGYECCQLGGTSSSLANAPMLGRQRIEVSSCFDVIFGPMSVEESRRFVSMGETVRDIWTSIRRYTGSVMDFSVSLTIDSTDTPVRSLGESALGLNLCLGSHPHQYQVRLAAPVFN